MDESEIIEEDDELIADTQFSGSGNDSNDPTTNTKQFRLIRQRQRQNLIYDAIHDDNVDDDDDDGSGAAVTYIETTEVDTEDPLNLEQICVPVDGDNVSWIGLSS